MSQRIEVRILAGEPMRKRWRATDERLADIKRLHGLGKSFSDIARLLGTDAATIGRHAKKLGLKSHRKMKPNMELIFRNAEIRE